MSVRRLSVRRVYWLRAICMRSPINAYFRTLSSVHLHMKCTFQTKHIQEGINKGFGSQNVLWNGHGYFAKHYHTSIVRFGSKMASSNVTYEDLLKLKANNAILLVDVREPEEIAETGKLPGSVHIPCELKTALESLSAEEFRQKYGVPKPELSSAMVFSCKAGVRSVKAMELAIKSGYKNSRSYGGGFMEWLEKTKK